MVDIARYEAAVSARPFDIRAVYAADQPQQLPSDSNEFSGYWAAYVSSTAIPTGLYIMEANLGGFFSVAGSISQALDALDIGFSAQLTMSAVDSTGAATAVPVQDGTFRMTWTGVEGHVDGIVGVGPGVTGSGNVRVPFRVGAGSSVDPNPGNSSDMAVQWFGLPEPVPSPDAVTFPFWLKFEDGLQSQSISPEFGTDDAGAPLLTDTVSAIVRYDSRFRAGDFVSIFDGNINYQIESVGEIGRRKYSRLSLTRYIG